MLLCSLYINQNGADMFVIRVIFSAVFFAIFATSGAFAQTTPLQISEKIFPSTREWKTVAHFVPLTKKELLARGAVIKSAYLASPLKEFEQKSCSFIDKTLQDPTAQFRQFDINDDGKFDIIYSGPAPCAEGDVSVVWFGTATGYEVKHTSPFQSLILKLRPAQEPLISSFAVGCCASLSDEYILGTFDNPRQDGALKILKTVELPKLYLPQQTSFVAIRTLALRSSPAIHDEYSKEQSEFMGIAVFGNIQRRYLQGARGAVLARQTHANGKEWAFVIMNQNSDALMTENPMDVGFGWVMVDEIR